MESNIENNINSPISKSFKKIILNIEDNLSFCSTHFSNNETHKNKKQFVNFFDTNKYKKIRNNSFIFNSPEISSLVINSSRTLSNPVKPDFNFIFGNSDKYINFKNTNVTQSQTSIFEIKNRFNLKKEEIINSNEDLLNNDLKYDNSITTLLSPIVVTKKGLPNFNILNDAINILNENDFLPEIEKKRFINLISKNLKIYDNFSKTRSIVKYLNKKKTRGKGKKVQYKLRQNIAISRNRKKGKFVKSIRMSLIEVATKLMKSNF